MRQERKNKESGNIIHLKFEYEEAVNYMRNILEIEESLMILAKKMKEYSYLRNEEAKAKSLLYRKSRKAKDTIKKLLENNPRIKTPEITFEKIKEKEKGDNSIEIQLREIQEKLSSIER